MTTRTLSIDKEKYGKNLKSFNKETSKNKAERLFVQFAHSNWWKLIQRGWPDYIGLTQGNSNIIMVEVKSSKRAKLSKAQQFVVGMLAEVGITCYRWSPDIGFTKVDGLSTNTIDKLISEKFI